jgi:mannosyltransferase
MNNGQKWLTTGLLLLILLLALALRLHGLGNQSFWNDEGTSVAVAQRDLLTIARDSARDIHPPLYYWLLSGWLRLVGNSEAAVRSFSALLGVVLVLLTYSIGKELLGRWAGLAAAFLAAISPFQIYYSQEARMYMLLTVLTAGAVLALTRLVERESFFTFVALVLFELAGLFTHYSFAFVVLVLNLAYLIWLTMTWRVPATQADPPTPVRVRVVKWLLAQTGVVLLYLPWLPTAIQQVTAWPNPARGGNVPEPLWSVLGNTWRWIALGPSVETATVAVPIVVAGVIAVCGVLFLALGWVGYPTPHHQWSASLLLLWIGLPVFLMIVLVLYRDAYLKFLLVTTPALSLLLVSGLIGAPPSNARLATQASASIRHEPRLMLNRSHLLSYALRLAQVLAAACVLAGSVIALRNYYTDPAFARDDYRGIAAYVEAVGRPGDAIVLNAPGQQEVFGYYYDGDLPVYPLPESRPLDPAATALVLDRLGQPGGRIFAVLWATEESDPGRFVEGWLDESAYKALDSWYGNVRLVVYALPGQTPSESEKPLSVVLRNPDNGDEIVLLGYTLQTSQLAAGDIGQFTFFWQADRTPSERYKVFLHLLDEEGHIVGQRDAEPGGGVRLTTLWEPGEVVADNHGLPVHPATPPGPYRVEVGVYNPDTGQRLVTAKGETQVWLEPLSVVRSPAPAPLAALGMQHATEAGFGALTLVGYDAYRLGFSHQPDAELRPGDVLHVNLYWRAEEAPEFDWQVVIALVDARGVEQAKITAVPAVGYPTSSWQAGEVWRGQVNLAVSRDAPPGWYNLQVQPLPGDGSAPQPFLSEPLLVGP